MHPFCIHCAWATLIVHLMHCCRLQVLHKQAKSNCNLPPPLPFSEPPSLKEAAEQNLSVFTKLIKITGLQWDAVADNTEALKVMVASRQTAIGGTHNSLPKAPLQFEDLQEQHNTIANFLEISPEWGVASLTPSLFYGHSTTVRSQAAPKPKTCLPCPRTILLVQITIFEAQPQSCQR